MVWTCRARDAYGNVIFDGANSLARLLGVIQTGTGGGSQVFDPGGGQLCFTVVSYFEGYSQGADVRVSGNTIIWTPGVVPSSIYVWAF